MTVLKPLLDENLPPPIDMSLRQWCRTYDLLRTNRQPDKEDEALVFALTGHYTDPTTGSRHRARLDYSRQQLDEQISFHQVTDIDSVIGIIRDNFPIQDDATVEYHLINDARYCLSSSIHIPGWPDPAEQGQTNSLLSYEKLPHGVFALMDKGRTVIRIVFPNALEDVEDSPFLTAQHLEPFYNQVVRPAATETVSDHYLRVWPPDYAAELTRARSRTGGPQFSGKPLRGKHLANLVPKMRELVANNPEFSWADDFFFMVEMKGVKSSTTHPPPNGDNVNEDGTLVNPDQDPRTQALNHLLSAWKFAEFDTNDWYLDIATTVSASRQDGTPVSLLIRKDAHPEIIRYFTNEPIDRCHRWAAHDNGRDYQFDETAQLGPIGGFRLTIADPQPKGIRYFQAYTTEKSLVYHKEAGSVALHSDLYRVLDNWEREAARFFDPVTEIFGQASDPETTSHIAVRFESRCLFDNYPFVHNKIPDLNLRTWLYGFNTRAVWGFKGRRLSSITRALDKIFEHRSSIQWDHVPEVSSLIALLIWMANSLANRPASGGTWDIVKHSGQVHKLDHLGEAEPVSPLLYYALHSLRLNPVYRLSSHRVIDHPILLRMISSKTFQAGMADLYVLLNPPAPGRSFQPLEWNQEPTPVQTLRIQPARSNKRRKVNTAPSSQAPQVFGTADGQIPIPCLDRLAVVQYESEDDDIESRSVGPVSCRELSELLHKIAVQLFAKAPSHLQSGNSYCLLNPEEKIKITNAVFQSREKLKTTWLSYTLFFAPEKWDNTVQRLFPTRSEYHQMTTNSRGQSIKFQGLHTLSFWTTWQTVLERLPTDCQDEVVQAMRTHVNKTWRWFPLIEGGKLWNTGQKPSQKHYGSLPTGPWIACNPGLP